MQETLTAIVASRPLRFAVAGAVGSTRCTLEGLTRNGARVVGVAGVNAERARAISGYVRLDDAAASVGAEYVDFHNINDPQTVETIRRWKPDFLFPVGLSQLLERPLLEVPRLGTIGFHPTWLPRGRGRAPIAWLVLDGRPGAATFFLMTEGVDAGAIVAQEPIWIGENEYAEDVYSRVHGAIGRALDRWIPSLLKGEWVAVVQNEGDATYDGRRAPADGLIDWNRPAAKIDRLVRATSRPHPGAYTYCQDRRIIIWRAELGEVPWRGVPGRILHFEQGRGWLVQTGSGLIWLREVEIADNVSSEAPETLLRVGLRLGYYVEREIAILRRRVSELESQLAEFTTAVSQHHKTKD